MADNSTLYLIRENRQYVQYTAVEDLTLTGAISSFPGITGLASTNVITVPGNTMVAGQAFYFQAIQGGAGLTANTTLWVVNPTGSTIQASFTQGGSAVDFTTDILFGTIIAAGPELKVWSSEYRDIFSGVTPYSIIDTVPVGDQDIPASTVYTPPQGSGVYIVNPVAEFYRTFDDIGSATVAATTGDLVATTSDEVAHYPLRQTLLNRTHWKFDRGATAHPRYLYAEWLPGDAIADNPPNRVITP